MAIIKPCQLDLNVRCKTKSECCDSRANPGLSKRLIRVQCSFARAGLEMEHVPSLVLTAVDM